MILRHLSITNFKNFEEARLEFSPKVNCFLGNNGMGKSNLLDAIYYLSFCKIFTGITDSMVMQLSAPGSRRGTSAGYVARQAQVAEARRQRV